MTHRTIQRRPAGIAAAVILALVLLLAACGDDAGGATTTQAADTTAAATTTDAVTTSGATTTSGGGATTISQIELLSGLLQSLLTGEEVSAALGFEPAWVDRGRQVIPPGSSQRTGFLCPEGQEILDPLGSAYDPQVSVTFGPAGEPGFTTWASESMLFEEAGRNAADFAVLASALGACAGKEPWATPEAGAVRIERLDLPAMGDQSYAVRITMGEGDDTGWIETRGIGILIGPVLIEVSVNMMHNADNAAAIGDGGLKNIAEAALAKIQEDLAAAEPITVEPADPDTLATYAGLMWGLLTTEEIGGGWVDRGRMIIPPSTAGEGFGADVLCPEGLALAAPIGSALDPLVSTTFAREGSPRLNQRLVFGHRDALTAAFSAGVAALEACFDREAWETPEAGSLRMHPLDMAALGAQSIAYYVGPGTTPGSDPWLEWQVVSILVTNLDPDNDNSVVINIEVATLHDPPGSGAEILDQAEIVRIAEAAIAKFEYDG